MPAKQLTFLKTKAFAEQNRLEHGGSLRAGRRKLARPIDTKRPLHLVLRSSRARGELSFLRKRNRSKVEALLRRYARRFHVKIYDLANAGNHLHVVLRAQSRQGFQNFLRTVSAMIARAVTGAKKGVKAGRFWDALAYTRVVEWGRSFVAMRAYLSRNRLEAIGFLAKSDRAASFSVALAAGNSRLNRRP